MNKVDRVRLRIGKKQRLFLEAFKATFSNVSQACERVGISRRSFYYWYNENEKFATKVEDIREGNIDLAESKLLMNIMANKETSIIFFLKTQGKKRGYVETIETEHSASESFLELMKEATASHDKK